MAPPAHARSLAIKRQASGPAATKTRSLARWYAACYREAKRITRERAAGGYARRREEDLVQSTAHRILVPVDGSAPSERALDLAVRLARGLGAELDVVTVLDLSQVDVYDGFYLSDSQLDALQRKAKTEILERAQQLVDDRVPVRTRLLRGRAAHVLLEEAEQPGVAMIVMGRTGKGAFERLVQGSVSRNLAAHSPVPITIVA